MKSAMTYFARPVALIWFLAAASARAPALASGSNEKPVAARTVSFALHRPGAKPERYVVRVESSGQAAYESRASEADADDPYSVNFAITPASLQRVFSLAQRAHFFEGDFDYRKHRIAYTGTKTLSYAESGRHFESSYNWSENTAIQELTTIFQAISNTLEAGQRLAYLKRFDKLGLVRELEDMERLSAEGDLMELQTISPLLQQISSDPSVLNIARERARKLLARSPQAQAAN